MGARVHHAAGLAGQLHRPHHSRPARSYHPEGDSPQQPLGAVGLGALALRAVLGVDLELDISRCFRIEWQGVLLS